MLKLRVLSDNYTLIDQYYRGEPGLCFFLESGGKEILFDLGYSGLFIENAQIMDLELSHVDMVVFSHGHNDHTSGVKEYIKFLEGRHPLSKAVCRKPSLLCHPQALAPKYEREESIGMPLSEEDLEKSFSHIFLSASPFWITPNLVFLGEIPRENAIENQALSPLWSTIDYKTKEARKDALLDDSALVYISSKGLVVLTGCAHAGIANIVAYAQEVCGEFSISSIIGGFHLFTSSAAKGAVSALSKFPIGDVYPCHCTSLHAKIELSRRFPIYEVGVGFQFLVS